MTMENFRRAIRKGDFLALDTGFVVCQYPSIYQEGETQRKQENKKENMMIVQSNFKTTIERNDFVRMHDGRSDIKVKVLDCFDALETTFGNECTPYRTFFPVLVELKRKLFLLQENNNTREE